MILLISILFRCYESKLSVITILLFVILLSLLLLVLFFHITINKCFDPENRLLVNELLQTEIEHDLGIKKLYDDATVLLENKEHNKSVKYYNNGILHKISENTVIYKITPNRDSTSLSSVIITNEINSIKKTYPENLYFQWGGNLFAEIPSGKKSLDGILDYQVKAYVFFTLFCLLFYFLIFQFTKSVMKINKSSKKTVFLVSILFFSCICPIFSCIEFSRVSSNKSSIKIYTKDDVRKIYEKLKIIYIEYMKDESAYDKMLNNEQSIFISKKPFMSFNYIRLKINDYCYLFFIEDTPNAINSCMFYEKIKDNLWIGYYADIIKKYENLYMIALISVILLVIGYFFLTILLVRYGRCMCRGTSTCG